MLTDIEIRKAVEILRKADLDAEKKVLNHSQHKKESRLNMAIRGCTKCQEILLNKHVRQS